MTEKITPSKKQIKKSLTDIATESWRFSRLFLRLLEKLDAGDSSRFINQHRFYLKRLNENLEKANIRLINLEGQSYDSGMAVISLNAEDFSPKDDLVIDQMIEPIIMGDGKLIKTGTVMLKKRVTK